MITPTMTRHRNVDEALETRPKAVKGQVMPVFAFYYSKLLIMLASSIRMQDAGVRLLLQTTG